MRGHVVTISHATGAWRELDRQYNVVLPDALGHPMLGFRDGSWFAIGPGGAPQPVTARTAILRYPASAGSVVQVMCWWMREFHGHPRAIDLATELAFTVSEMASMAGLRPHSRQIAEPARRPEPLPAGSQSQAQGYSAQPPHQGRPGQPPAQPSYQSPYQQPGYQQQYPQPPQRTQAPGYPNQPQQGGYQNGYRAEPVAGGRGHDPLTSPYF